MPGQPAGHSQAGLPPVNRGIAVARGTRFPVEDEMAQRMQGRPAVPMPAPPADDGAEIRCPWLHVLTVGLVLSIAATAVTVITSNTTLLPTVILLGSFLVPVASALAWCARGLRVHTAGDGALLGATVGFGFAALESAGYAFNALFTEQGGLSLGTLVQTG
jgi:PrsW family intramembrane metalloprotease